ncbi:uncharacterized protein RHO25_012918 [Cercospora beticola]|uniref:Uncharacterized protein n=1 Tax=Cercospora beticola TaxID=122368 RepID=A0ABZ0P8V9_CERBT|nr:hypothetical protein RHO25_012918 [Cercospora beticola]
MTAKGKEVKVELWQLPPPPKSKNKEDPEFDKALAVPEARISALCGIAKALCLDTRGSYGIKFARDSAK